MLSFSSYGDDEDESYHYFSWAVDANVAWDGTPVTMSEFAKHSSIKNGPRRFLSFFLSRASLHFLVYDTPFSIFESTGTIFRGKSFLFKRPLQSLPNLLDWEWETSRKVTYALTRTKIPFGSNTPAIRFRWSFKHPRFNHKFIYHQHRCLGFQNWSPRLDGLQEAKLT